MKALVILAVVFMTACPTTVCQSLETRCAEDVAQVCDARGRWQDVLYCDDVRPGTWECGEEDGEHSCYQSNSVR